MDYKIKVVLSDCIGCGACVMIAEEVFDFDQNGYAYLIKNSIISTELEDKVNQSILICPTKAIIKVK